MNFVCIGAVGVVSDWDHIFDEYTVLMRSFTLILVYVFPAFCISTGIDPSTKEVRILFASKFKGHLPPMLAL